MYKAINTRLTVGKSPASPVEPDSAESKGSRESRRPVPDSTIFCGICFQPVTFREVRLTVRQSTNSRFLSHSAGVISFCGPHGFGWAL